jgi:hypothetical protein
MSICVDAARATHALTVAGRAANVPCGTPQATPTAFTRGRGLEAFTRQIARWRANPELEILDGKSEL